MKRWLSLAAIVTLTSCIKQSGILIVVPDDAGHFAPVDASVVRIVDCRSLPRPYSIVASIVVQGTCDDGAGVLGVIRKEAARRGANYIVEPNIAGCDGAADVVRSLDEPGAPSADLCPGPQAASASSAPAPPSR